jgi:hypothetical protein
VDKSEMVKSSVEEQEDKNDEEIKLILMKFQWNWNAKQHAKIDFYSLHISQFAFVLCQHNRSISTIPKGSAQEDGERELVI